MLKKILLATITSAVLFACGGGASGGFTGSSGTGGSGGTGSQSINITNYSVSPNVFHTYSTFTVKWNVSQNLAGGYNVKFYINNTQNETVIPQFQYNAGLSVYTFGNQGSVDCKVMYDNITNSKYTLCSPTNLTGYSPQSRTLAVSSGTAYAIIKTCGWNTNLDEVCDKEVIQIQIQ